MNEIKTILACVRNADKKYNLINPGDKIAVGISLMASTKCAIP